MRIAAPVAIALAAVAAFTLQGLAYASWAVERSPAWRSDPSLECAGGVVFAALVAIVVGVVSGIASGFAARHSFVGRRRAGLATSAGVIALVAGAHWLQLHYARCVNHPPPSSSWKTTAFRPLSRTTSK